MNLIKFLKCGLGFFRHLYIARVQHDVSVDLAENEIGDLNWSALFPSSFSAHPEGKRDRRRDLVHDG